MFNFFDELKRMLDKVEPQALSNYNIVNVSGRILYVEGHLGLTMLTKELITFKVKRGRVTVEGKDMILAELTDSTIKITGLISKVEVI